MSALNNQDREDLKRIFFGVNPNLGDKVAALFESAASGNVASVTGYLVDNTDPLNPVTSLPYKIYNALLSQVAPDTQTGGLLIVGETYTIDTYVAAQEQIDTVTLTGSSGTADISDAGDLTKGATFATDLPTTAANFVTAHAAAYLAVGIVITSSGDDIIFTANVAGVGFVSPVITNKTGNLDGTMANTQVNLTGDDFLNVGALVNQTSEIFIATGTTPADYSSGSTLDSAGNPTVIISQNTIGNIVWSYSNIGAFIATLPGEFPLDKTFIFIGALVAFNYGVVILKGGMPNYFELETLDSNSNADDILINTEIEIRVYN